MLTMTDTGEIILLASLFMSFLRLISMDKYEDICQQRFYIPSEENKSIDHKILPFIFPEQRTFSCQYELLTEPGRLIRIHIQNSLTNQLILTDQNNCTENYIHIGNDERRIGVEMLTSYKLCQTTGNEEIVSRGNYLWVIIVGLSAVQFSRLTINVHSKPTVVCNETAFQCSPVQCVSHTAVCNGVQDCDNGRDEYCGAKILRPLEVIDPAETCFMCRDGSCISPSLPRYSLDWGKSFWYICDHFNHCPDGTDEIKDICYRIKGRSTALFQCTPKGTNFTAYMWDTIVCDGREDCEHGEDEASELCQTNSVKFLDVKPISIIIPLVAVVVVSIGAFSGKAIYKMHERGLTLPTTCLDTMYVFTEVSDTTTPNEPDSSNKGDLQLQSDIDDLEDQTDTDELDIGGTDDLENDLDPDNTIDGYDNGVNDDIVLQNVVLDNDLDIDDDFANEETIFNLTTKTIQTSV